jgi:transcriptional regulator with XRE-family HTH domain
MLLRHAIGSVLRRIRTEQGSTLRQLSETSRVSIPYLSEIERGRKEASSEILAALCRVLTVTEGELLIRVAAEFQAVQSDARVLSLLPGSDPADPPEGAGVPATVPAVAAAVTPAPLLLVA